MIKKRVCIIMLFLPLALHAASTAGYEASRYEVKSYSYEAPAEAVTADPEAELVDRVVTRLESEKDVMPRGFFFDGYAHATLLRERDIVPGGTLSFGYRNGMSLYGIYGRFDYFLNPLGTTTGRIATLEFNAEAGLSFRYVVASQDWQEIKLGVDIGYYSQWLERNGTSSVFFLSYNGLMLRPSISVKANLLLFRIELGLYYQSAVYPRYSDYDGFGLYIKLF